MKRRTFLQSVGAMSVLGFGAKEAASTPFITQGYYPTFFDELDIATKGLKRGSLTLITGAFCNSFGEVMRSQMLMRWAPKCIPYSNDTMPCPEPILGSCDRPIFGSLDRTGRLCHVANDCSASFHVFWRNYIGPMNIKVLFVSGGFGGNYSSRYLYWLIKNARKYNYALVFQHCRPMLWIQYESNLILNTGFDYVLIKKNNARISNERFIWDVRTTWNVRRCDNEKS